MDKVIKITRTLVLIKPDGIERGLIGEVIKRFEDRGLKIIAMKMLRIDRELAEKHYAPSEQQINGMGEKTLSALGPEKSKKIIGSDNPREIGLKAREWMIDLLISGPVAALILEGEDAVGLARQTIGFADPPKAEEGTIRRDLGQDSIAQANTEGRVVRNLVHASGSEEEAEKEIGLWFSTKEIIG